MKGTYEYGKENKTEPCKKGKQGTTILWKPHKKPFKSEKINSYDIQQLCVELGHICPGLELVFINADTGEKEVTKVKSIGDFIEHTISGEGHKLLSPVMTFSGKEDGVSIEGAMAWTSGSNVEYSYVNLIPTKDGGTHVSSFKTALTREWNQFFETSFKGDDIRQGFFLVLSVKMEDEPQFSGQSKEKLNMPEVNASISQLVSQQLFGLFDRHRKFFVDYNRALEKQRQRQEIAKLMKGITSESKKGAGNPFANLSDKYKGCTNKKDIELFIVEGDSAMGGINLTKSANNQAVYAVRGKVFNVFDKSLEQSIHNNEIRELVKILGEEEDALKNFDKIIIASDADEDGAQIFLLILGFLATFYPGLITAGRVYRLITPRYIASNDKGFEVCYEDDDEWVSKQKKDGNDVTYLKGLGQIRMTIMEEFVNPKTRKLMLVSPEEWEEFYDTLEIALSGGSHVMKQRKELLLRKES